MDSKYLKELEEEIQKRKAEAELQFNQMNINSKNSNPENSNHQSDLEQENNFCQEQEHENIEQSQENNVEEDDNDIVNEGIKSVTDDNKAENNMNFDLKEEQNGENIKTIIKKIENDKDECNDQETLERLNWAKQAIIQILE